MKHSVFSIIWTVYYLVIGPLTLRPSITKNKNAKLEKENKRLKSNRLFLRYYFYSLLVWIGSNPLLLAQQNAKIDKQNKAILSLIDQYSEAREKQDSFLLKRILTEDLDQLVSSGEWRLGIAEAVKGMLQSSRGNPGTRKLIVDRVRFLDANNSIADARYEIQNPDGTVRRMWSTFIVVNRKGIWKIAGIRNMLPAVDR